MIFAHVQNIAAIPDEKEVLFDISSTFEIDCIKYDDETTRQVWIVKMHCTNKAEELVNTVLQKHPHKTIEIFRNRYLEWTEH